MEASAIQGSLSVYAGFVWGFDEFKGIEEDYAGASTSGSVGLTLNIPDPAAPYLSLGLGVGVGKFRAAAPSQAQGYIGYVSGGVQIGILPTNLGVGVATSVVNTWYTMYRDTLKSYGTSQNAELSTLASDIGNGEGVPFFNVVVGYIPGIPALVRNTAADIGTYVVAQHYATRQ